MTSTTDTRAPQHHVIHSMGQATASTGLTAGQQVPDALWQQPRGASKLRNKKCCCICCSITIVLIVASGLIGFFVLGPVIAKKAMANSVITFDKLSMTNVIANQSILVASDITINHVSPLGCTIGAMEVTLMDDDLEFGKLTMPSMSVEASVDNHRSIGATVLKITNVTLWNKVCGTLLMNSSATWRLKGSASVTSKQLGMSVTFHGVPFDKKVDFRGFNGFAGDMKVLSLDVVGAHDGSLDMEVDCEVTNPSNVAASMGPVALELWTSGTTPFKIGELQIADFKLNADVQGGAVTKFSKIPATYTPPAGGAGAAAAREFLSTFVQGKLQTVGIRGFNASTPMWLMQQAMAGFTTSSALPGLVQNKLLLKGLMYIPNLLKPYDLPTQLIVQNPFSAPMNFHSAYCEIYPCKTFEDSRCTEFWEKSSGFYSPDVPNEIVPSKSQRILAKHPVKLYELLTPEMIMTAFKGAGNGSFIRLKGNTTIGIGNTHVSIDYEEEYVPICLVYPLHNCAEFVRDFRAKEATETSIVI